MHIKVYVFLFMLVTAAIIFNKNKILIAKRNGGWEFPGGKVEKDESMEECIIREIKEELGISINLLKPFSVEKDKDIEMHVFLASYKGGEIKLKVHKDVKWLTIDEAKLYNFLSMDKKIIEKLARCR